MKILASKGTYDCLPERSGRMMELVRRSSAVLETYGFTRIETPIFELSELFSRSIGEETDIVSKEMYTFIDKGERSLTLRPEGTAGVVRAYIEHNLDQQGVDRLWYYGPMFRYEQPQAGRQRQFTQLGVEVFGDSGPIVDAEVIELFMRICVTCGLRDLTVQLNSIGCPECRGAYSQRIRDTLRPFAEKLCGDCQRRLEKNPLRVLDCKNESCSALTAAVPSLADSLCEACRTHFAIVRELLDALEIPYALQPRLVRGLDYYTRTAFEIQIPGHRGAQNAIGGGGRYDRLIEQMGGKPTPGIGFAFGVERMLNLVASQGANLAPAVPALVYVAWMGQDARPRAVGLASELRSGGVAVRMDGAGTRSLGKQMQAASKLGARLAAILGEDEVARSTVGLKNLETREQVTVPWPDAVVRIREALAALPPSKGVAP